MTASFRELMERLYECADSEEETQSAEDVINRMKDKLSFLGGKE